jgi:hypothetical protein
LQHQRGFADARVAAHEDDGAGHDPAAEDARELSDRQVDSILRIAADLGDGTRFRTTAQPADI